MIWGCLRAEYIFVSSLFLLHEWLVVDRGKLENQWFGNNLGSKMLYQMLLVSHQYRPHLPVPSASIYIYLPEYFHWPPKLTLSTCRKQVVNAKELAPNQEQPSSNDYPEHPLLSCLLNGKTWSHVLILLVTHVHKHDLPQYSPHFPVSFVDKCGYVFTGSLPVFLLTHSNTDDPELSFNHADADHVLVE